MQMCVCFSYMNFMTTLPVLFMGTTSQLNMSSTSHSKPPVLAACNFYNINANIWAKSCRISDASDSFTR